MVLCETSPVHFCGELVGTEKEEKLDAQTVVVVDSSEFYEKLMFADNEQEHAYYHKQWNLCCSKEQHNKEAKSNELVVRAIGHMFD